MRHHKPFLEVCYVAKTMCFQRGQDRRDRITVLKTPSFVGSSLNTDVAPLSYRSSDDDGNNKMMMAKDLGKQLYYWSLLKIVSVHWAGMDRSKSGAISKFRG